MSQCRPFDCQRALDRLEAKYASLNPEEKERMLRSLEQPGPYIRITAWHVHEFLRRQRPGWEKRQAEWEQKSREPIPVPSRWSRMTEHEQHVYLLRHPWPGGYLTPNGEIVGLQERPVLTVLCPHCGEQSRWPRKQFKPARCEHCNKVLFPQAGTNPRSS